MDIITVKFRLIRPLQKYYNTIFDFVVGRAKSSAFENGLNV